MLYLDYSRQPGEWVPTAMAGAKTSRYRFPQAHERGRARRFPGILTIAKNPQPGPASHVPFISVASVSALKWNMGWMNDTLKYFHPIPSTAKYEQNKLTFSLIYAFTENFMLPFSHDEVVHGKSSFSTRCPATCGSNMQISACYSPISMPIRQETSFHGQEFAQRSEWSEEHSLDWHLLHYASHQGVKQLVADLNHLHAAEPPFRGGFRMDWLRMD